MSRNWSHLVRKRENLEVLFLILPFLFFCCCCCSVAKSCLTLCGPTDCSMLGLPVPPHLLEFAQIYVHWISDVIQPSHPLSPASPSAFNLSQHQGLFQRVSCLHQVAKVLEFLTSAFYPSILPTNSKFKLYFLPPSVTTSRTIFLTLNWKMLILIFFSGRTHTATNPSC